MASGAVPFRAAGMPYEGGSAVRRGHVDPIRGRKGSVRVRGGAAAAGKVQQNLREGKVSGRGLDEVGVVWGLFCDFREILSHFTANRLTSTSRRDRISSEVS